MYRSRSWFSLIVLACACALSSCAGLADSPYFGERAASVRLEQRGRYAGLRTGAFANSVVTVDPALPLETRRRVAVHELLHVAGLKGHEHDPRCFLYGSAVPGLPAHLCPAERRRLLRVTGVVVVRASEEAHDEVAWAIDFLNREMGRDCFRFAVHR